MDDPVNWKTMSRHRFEAVVEALLIAEWDRDGWRCRVIDGRGGDDGIDVGVWNPDRVLVHIFQLKHFPEGFSGGHRHRRTQIRESLDEALKKNQPRQWTLVFPGNPTVYELNAVLAMRDGRPVKIDIHGIAELDVLLGTHEGVHRRFWTNHTLEYLSALQRPEEALAKMTDLGPVMDRVGSRLDARSSHWGSRIARDEYGVVTEEIVARTEDAHLREPIGFTLTPRFDDSTADVRDRFIKAVRFGVMEEVVLPAQTIERFERTGPGWWADDAPVGEFRMLPDGRPDERTLTMTVRDPASDKDVRSLEAKVLQRASGTDGLQLKVEVQGGLIVRWTLPHAGMRGGELTFETMVGRYPARQVRRIGQFRAALADHGRIVLRADDLVLAIVDLKDFDLHRPDAEYMAYLDDLVAIEHAYDVDLTTPDKPISEVERLWARTLHLVADGDAVPVPGVNGYTGVLHEPDTDGALRQLIQDGGPYRVVDEPTITVNGTPVPLGTMIFWQPRAEFVDRVEILAAIDAGTATGREIVIAGEYGIPWTILRPRTKNDSEPRYVGWEVEGIDEHPGLGRLRALEAEEPGS